MTHRQIVSSFNLLGFDGDPGDLTKQLGIKPTRQYRKGDIPRPGAGPYPQSGWSIASGVEDNLNMAAHIAGAIAVAEPVLLRIPDYSAKKTISCGLYQTPGYARIFYLEPHLIAMLARLCVGLDIDIIHLP